MQPGHSLADLARFKNTFAAGTWGPALPSFPFPPCHLRVDRSVKLWPKMSTTLPSVLTTTAIFTFPSYYSHAPYTTAVIWSNFGPLTTTFTPPASCSGNPSGVVWASSDGVPTGSQCDHSVGPATYFSCLPSASALLSIESQAIQRVSSGLTAAAVFRYHSPGLYCPSGYSVAQAITIRPSDVVTTRLGADVIRATGTHILCCPRYVLPSQQVASLRLTGGAVVIKAVITIVCQT